MNWYRDLKKFFKDHGENDEFGFEWRSGNGYLVFLSALRHKKEVLKGYSSDGKIGNRKFLRNAGKFVISCWRDHQKPLTRAVSFLPFAKFIILRRLASKPNPWLNDADTKTFNRYGVPSKEQGGTN